MSTEHDEQPTELTYPTTIRLVLASDDSDKENHIPDIRRDEIAVKLEQPTTESLGGNSIEGTGGSTAIDRSDPLCQDLPRSVTPDTGTNGAETTRIMASMFQFLLCLIQVTLAYRRLRNRLRQTRTITHLTSIRIRDSHYRLSNLPSPPHSNNDDHGLSLPDQPRLLRPIVQCPGLPPPHP
jgi:hypothetical protein